MSLTRDILEKGVVETYRSRRERRLRGQVKSPILPVTVSPVPVVALTLTVDKTTGYVGDTFVFRGKFTQNGVAVVGAIVTLFRDTIAVGTATTDSVGAYSIRWTANVTGSFSFHSEATTPAKPITPVPVY